MKHLKCLLLFLLFLFGACNKKEKTIVINTDDYSVRFSQKGEFIRLIVPSLNISQNLKAYTLLEDCECSVDTFKMIPTGGVEFFKHYKSKKTNDSCSLLERFVPAEKYLIWQLEIEGNGAAWSTGIQSVLELDNPDEHLFWTTWGSPEQLMPSTNSKTADNTWYDPFTPRSFRDMNLTYGEHCALGAAYAVPLASVFEKYKDAGFTMMMSAYDPMLDVRMQTTTDGKIIQTRRNNRIEKNKKLVFTTILFYHPADWRGVMKVAIDRYEEEFVPKCSIAGEISGCGAYSSFEGKLDIEKYKKMGGIVNWKASFDFPYMGYFIPDVRSDNEKWKRMDCSSSGEIIKNLATYTSISNMYKYFSDMHDWGFYTLAYFNFTEFGAGIEYPCPETMKKYEYPAYKMANDYLYSHFPKAMIFGSFDSPGGWLFRTGGQQMNPKPLFHDKPYWSWAGSVAMDCGDSAYSYYILKQAKRHIEKFPDMDGICIDRMDWLGEYNWKADDGISMVDGKPVRSIMNSWKNFMTRLGPLMHNSNKAIFCNPHIHRYELMTHVDGIFNEGGFEWDKMNLSAFLCFYKPLIIWTPEGKIVDSSGVQYFEYRKWNQQVMREKPDDYLQKILYMGAFPMAPFPGNDHSIDPDSAFEKYFLDYGRIFNAIRERIWILEPHVISVEKEKALTNLFVTPDNYIAPVIYGKADEVTVVIRMPQLLTRTEALQIKALYPGENVEHLLDFKTEKDEIIVEVPLKRGCAFLKINK
jgi:hypothetical protein